MENSRNEQFIRFKLHHSEQRDDILPHRAPVAGDMKHPFVVQWLQADSHWLESLRSLLVVGLTVTVLAFK